MPLPEPSYGRAVILTALHVEYEAVRTHLRSLHEEVHEKGTIYERGEFVAGQARWEIGIVQVGKGNTAVAVEAERAISYFAPDIVFFVGVAGGIKDVALGDVVAATKVYGYESGKVVQSKFLARPDVGQSSHSLVQRAMAESRKKDWLQRIHGRNQLSTSPRVFVGPIAAGEKVIASTRSPVFRLLYSTYNDALAVEMEGSGFLHATHANGDIQTLIIRGISDMLDGKSQADALGSQEMAARHASAFAFEILAKLNVTDVRSRTQSVNTTPGASLSRQTIASSKEEDLHLEDIYINESGETPVLDITLRNEGTKLALPTRVKIEVLDVGEFYHCDDDDDDIVDDDGRSRSFMIESQSYEIELSPELKGKDKFIKIAHQLIPQEADRFHVAIYEDVRDTTRIYVWYHLKITIIYNKSVHTTEDASLLLSVPPVNMKIGNVWQSQHDNTCAEKNRATLQRMATLVATRSDSVEKAIRVTL